MKITHFALTASLAIGGTIVSGAMTPAAAFTLFLGEDIATFPNGDNLNAANVLNSQQAETDFLAKLSGFASEQFDTLTPGFSTLTNLANGATISTTSTDGGIAPFPANGRFPISGTQYYNVGADSNSDFSARVKRSTTISFANPMAALGFYTTDIENLDGIELQLRNGTNIVQTQFVAPSASAANGAGSAISGSALYLSLIADNPSETFDNIVLSLRTTNPGLLNDNFGIDNLTSATTAQIKSFSATAVPEPFTIIGTTLGIASAFQIRKKLKSENKL